MQIEERLTENLDKYNSTPMPVKTEVSYVKGKHQEWRSIVERTFRMAILFESPYTVFREDRHLYFVLLSKFQNMMLRVQKE